MSQAAQNLIQSMVMSLGIVETGQCLGEELLALLHP